MSNIKLTLYGSSLKSALRHQCAKSQRKSCLEAGECYLESDRPGRPPTKSGIEQLKACTGKYLVTVEKVNHPLPMHPSVKDEGGTLSMNISSVDKRSIIKQEVVNGRLITTFKAVPWDSDDRRDFQPAGSIMNEPYRGELDEKALAYDRECFEAGELGHDMVLSETVTRFETLFWDKGIYTEE